ncbi:MAG TPA: molybdopterin-dependent oxidoreductase [Steroidobacteraceae bacterium]|nr:molybdopterin-dependent oxidoreductase [Steroidobacteraceae bacterium]
MVIKRREVLASSAGLLLLGAVGARSDEPPVPGATDDVLVALPGKKPLIKRSFRPPNFETPIADLREAFTPNERFFVRYHLADIPEVDRRSWRLKVGGSSAQRSVEFSLAELKRGFEHVSIAAVNQCSGNRRGLFTPRAAGIQWQYGAMGNAMWGGVRLRDVLNRVGIKADALEVVLDGADRAVLPVTPDFVKSLPIERALDENTLIAFEMNGAALPHWNGAPARLVVPGWTATYWVKHLAEIRVEPKPFDGFWMKTAYRVPTGAFAGARFASQETPQTTPITEILVNSLVTSHSDGARLARGRTAELSGWAWDGGSGIGSVEVSTDDGQSWRSATLAKDLGRFAWRGFHFAVETSTTGSRALAVRAVSRAGARQPDKLTPNPSGYHHNLVQRLTLEVA